MRALQKRIAFLSIFEIGYCALGRGDAERSECSPFWRVPSLTNVACRVAIKATALRLMAPGSRCDTQWHPRKRPTVGAGSSRFSRRFPRPPDSPYAKIPPPTVPAAQTLPAVPSTIRRHGSPAYGASRFAPRPVPTRHAGDSPSWASPARYLRGVERGIAALQTTPPPSATWRAASRLKITAAHSPNIASRSPITVSRLELPVRYKKEAR